MRTQHRLRLEPRWLAGLLGALCIGAFALGFPAIFPGAADRARPAELELGPSASSGQAGVGRPLPDLVLLDHEGRALTFDALRGQPVWLAFFRGADCPYCRHQLQELATRASEIARAGVQLLAVTPDPPATSARLRRELGLPFPFLSDQAEQAVTALCGGLAHCQLLVDARGIVRWAGLNENWSGAPGPEVLLEAARRLGESR